MMRNVASEIRDCISMGYSNKETAEFLGCTTEYVAIEKRKMRLKERRASDGGKHRGPEIREMLRAGARVCDIAVKLGCCESTVHRHKKAMNDE